MNKKVLSLILFIAAVAAIAYAVYRSPAETITVTEIGREIAYGSPQHGLAMGLCIFSGFCVLGAVLLLLEDGRNVVHDQRNVTKKAAERIATNYPIS
jgi:hypothetical protein